MPSSSSTGSDPTDDGSLDLVSGSEDPEQSCQSTIVSEEAIAMPPPLAERARCLPRRPAREAGGRVFPQAGGRSVPPADESVVETEISYPGLESFSDRLAFRPLPRGVAVTVPPCRC